MTIHVCCNDKNVKVDSPETEDLSKDIFSGKPIDARVAYIIKEKTYLIINDLLDKIQLLNEKINLINLLYKYMLISDKIKTRQKQKIPQIMDPWY